MLRWALRLLVGMGVLAGVAACTLPSGLPGGQGAPTALPQPTSLGPSPAPPTPVPTQPGVCLLTAQQDTPIYQRPSTAAALFGTLPAGDQVEVTHRTADGWYGFDPAVAHAGDVGIFRLRWIQAGAGVSLSGPCDTLPVVASLPPGVCFVMPMVEAPVYAQPQQNAQVLGSLSVEEYAAAVARGPDAWVQVNLDLGANHLQGQGWVRLTEVGLNGPCDALPQGPPPPPPTVPSPTSTPSGSASGGEERIQFALGATSWQKTLASGEDAFVFTALQGQSVEILLTEGGQPADAALALAAPNGQPLQTYNVGWASWRGVLPQTGDYHLSIAAPQGVQGLTLVVTIFPPPAEPHVLADPGQGYHLVYDGEEFLPQPPPPVFTSAVVSLYLAKSDFYMNTNLEEAFFVLTGEPYGDADVCLNAPPEDVLPITEAVDTWRVNGVVYRHYRNDDAGAGHFYHTETFRTYAASHCFTAYLFVHSTNIANYPSGSVTPYDEQGVQDALKRLFLTLRWP